MLIKIRFQTLKVSKVNHIWHSSIWSLSLCLQQHKFYERTLSSTLQNIDVEIVVVTNIKHNFYYDGKMYGNVILKQISKIYNQWFMCFVKYCN